MNEPRIPTPTSSTPPRPAAPPPATTGALARCEQHRERFADWVCTRCAKTWCAECALVTRAVHTKAELVQCPACRDRCTPSVRRQRQMQREQRQVQDRYSLGWALRDALMRPFSGWGAFVWLGCGLLFAVPELSRRFFEGIALGGVLQLLPVAYFLRIVRHAATGGKGFPEGGEVTDWYYDLIFPALRFFLGCWLVMLPAGIYLILGLGDSPGRGASDPTFWILFAAGLFYLPGVIITTAMTESVAVALNPVVTVQLMGRVGADYLVLLLGSLALGAFELLDASTIPTGIALALPWIQVYATLAIMGLFGNILYRKRDRLGIDA